MEGILLFAVSIGTLGAIYGMVTLALNLETGTGPLWDLGIVSFFGIGAYAYVILTAAPADAHQHYLYGFGLPIWLGMIGAAIAGGLAAFLIGLPSLKLRKEYFLIITLAFAEVIRQLYINEEWLTNGVAGIYGLDQPLRGLVEARNYSYVLFGLSLLGLLVIWFLTRMISLSAFGRACKALRENEPLAITAGINPRATSMVLYILAGAFTAIAGVFYVWFNTLVVPGQFSSDLTFFVWTALIIGGIGSSRGALLGAFVFIVLHDAMRFLQVSGEMAVVLTSLRTVLIGLLLVLILRFRPNGIFPESRVIFRLPHKAAARRAAAKGAV